MKLQNLAIFLTASLLVLSGCSPKPTPKKEAAIDETLPTVKLTKNGTIVDVNAIALEWESFSDQRVKGVYIYKAKVDVAGETTSDYHDTVNNRFTTHYLDTDIEPGSKYSYYFKTYSNKAESLNSEATLIESLPVMESVSWIHAVQNMPRSAKVLWRPHSNEKVNGYIIQRRTLESDKWKDVTTVDGRLSAEYIDDDLKDRFTYMYRILSTTYDKLVSKPTKEVSVITKALPLDVDGITATIDLPKKIEVRWNATASTDFLAYRVYSAESVDGSYKVISEQQDNVYIDSVEEDAKQYFYRVSVVDKDGLESIHDKYSIQGMTLIKPKTPSLVSAELVKNEIKISWNKEDERAVSYIVQKRYRKNLFKGLEEEFEGIKGLDFVDTEIAPENTYKYVVFSVDEHGIKSEPSIEVVIKTDKTVNIQESSPIE
ncbi:hypothetical protein N9A28_04155 [Sulfurimonas sp.]|nr:hypothetical protein [Sulfurimonas sp.]